MRSVVPSRNIIQSQQGYETPSSMRTVALDGVRNSRLSTFNQKSSNKEMATYDLHKCPPSMQTACELRICSSWRTELKIVFIERRSFDKIHEGSSQKCFIFHINWRKIEKWGLHRLTDISSNFFYCFQVAKIWRLRILCSTSDVYILFIQTREYIKK